MKKGIIFNSLITIILILIVIIIVTIGLAKGYNIAKEGVFSSISFLDNIFGFSNTPIKTISFEDGNFKIKFKDSYNDKIVIKTIYNNGNSNIDSEEAINLKDKKEVSYNINFDVLNKNLFSRIDFEIYDSKGKELYSKNTYYVIYPEYLEGKSIGGALTYNLLELYNPKIFLGVPTKIDSSTAKVYKVFDSIFFPNNNVGFLNKVDVFCITFVCNQNYVLKNNNIYTCVKTIQEHYKDNFENCNSHFLYNPISSRGISYTPLGILSYDCNYTAKLILEEKEQTGHSIPSCKKNTDELNIIVNYDNLPSDLDVHVVEYNNKKYVFIKKTW